MTKELIDILHNGNHSLVVDNGVTATFDGHGVSDLYQILTETPDILHGADVADKIVGKGAAALMILGNVKSVYADVISTPALRLLQQSSVDITFCQEVANIVNRKGDGICPVEALCLDCKTAEECMPLITKFLNSNNKK